MPDREDSFIWRYEQESREERLREQVRDLLPGPHVYTVAANWQIRDWEFYVTRIWLPAVFKGISRRGWLDALQYLDKVKGRVFWQDGRPYKIPEIGDVFEPKDNRWMTDFLEADETGDFPATHCRKFERLRLICLYNDVALNEPFK